ncbi:PAS domain S-box protein [Halobaculum litoreum]|uniref:PAS domain S-box protein n=1 Tax=Halobaculum litoreum TaxID=3031998 RepID=A0ABD5XNP3_9EURY
MKEGERAVSRRRKLSVFEGAPGEPFTSTEVAEAVGCARTTAYKRLRRLAADGDLRTKKVGARGRVWWLPAAGAGTDRPSEGDDTDLDKARQYRAVFEAAFDAILIADDDARYVDANPAACELLGLPYEAVLGERITDFAAPGYDVESAWGDFRSDGLDRGLFPLQRPDGERRTVEFAATPDVLPGRHLAILRDVTERHEARVEAGRERRRAERYQRSLAADAVIEVTFRIPEATVLSDLAAAVGDRCEFEESSRRPTTGCSTT